MIDTVKAKETLILDQKSVFWPNYKGEYYSDLIYSTWTQFFTRLLTE